jgi:hypothetical protein
MWFKPKEETTNTNPWWKPIVRAPLLTAKDIFIPKPVGGYLEPIQEVTVGDGKIVNQKSISEKRYNDFKSNGVKPVLPTLPTPIVPTAQAATITTQPVNINKMLEVFRHQESRGEKNPYSFSQYSGVENLGDALGAYQVTEGELRTYGKKYLGKDVTAKQFLENPKLQDTYMTNKIIDFENRYKFSVPEMFGAHRGGIGGRSNPNYQQYIQEAVNLYNG